MIHIDFQAGTHGNYLEFVCNVIAGVQVGNELPFDSMGAAHNKSYKSDKIFYSDHYSYTPKSFLYNKIVSIQFDVKDLLQIQQISLLRAGNDNYDNDKLEVDTFNKLNNRSHRWMLDNIIDSFFYNQIQQSYNAVKDPTWPAVTNLSDFKKLPSWIQDECRTQHNLILLEISPESPNCPRHVLREFFQIGFENPMKMGFMSRQLELKYNDSYHVYVFPFKCFYNSEQFLLEIKKLAKWAKLSYTCEDKITKMHKEFLNRQVYKNSKRKCDDLIPQLTKENNIKLPKLDLLEEAYINAKLGWNYFK